METNRRQFLQAGLAGLAVGGLSTFPLARVVVAARRRDLTVTQIDRVTTKIPYREIPARNMGRELPHWRYLEVFSVHLQSGHVGHGETMLYYTWGASTDEDVKFAQGKNAAELMWDDSLGAGLQMALFDAVARASDVPIHRLLGEQIHGSTALSWWNIDTSVDDMVAECREAYRQGYMAYKTKGRPWFDVWEQVAQAAKAVPDAFKIDMDFNDTLLDAERAIPILKDLEQHPEVAIYETPIPQGDIKGNQAIRKATRVAIAMHYGNPDPLIALKEEVCDGFVIGGGASRLMKQGHVAAMADKPFWLQLVGSGITAALSLHFGAVLSHATWPAVNCHQLFQHSLLKEPIRVKNGVAQVPDKPGLGYDLDWETIEKFRVAKPRRRPDPPRLIETSWTDGGKMYFAPTGRVNFVLTPGRLGQIPFYRRGVTTRLVDNDGSERWQQLYEQARRKPVYVKE